MKSRLLIVLGVALCCGIVVTQAATPAARAETKEASGLATTVAGDQKEPSPLGVCPPFKLRDEQGNIIDPVHDLNTDVPYSPKQTCGACHDYGKITQGFHFTQGKGEAMPQSFADRYNWASAPGNYGGNWCSPAPLYRQLAPKANASARTIDMTSFEFVTATCGNCHPGGGPMEFDRSGQRYDLFMKQEGLVSGGDNGLDGDYHKARWAETGVIEADCLLCHMPEYNFKARNAQLEALNFRWAASEGAGLGKVAGKVSAGDKPRVSYDSSRFDSDGNVVLHMAPQPRNETCLNCHAKPDWKKRGAAYSTRTDVHIAAGLRCVDCHAAGSRAVDGRIRGKEVHQFGKGDDPSGWVRNDLDNTVRSCEACHLNGWNNAPKATHAWLPPLHMEKMSCQACHIPTRAVKSALVQASDVYNPAPRITPPGKHIWTFYDQEMSFWNHYGELELFTVKDQPTNVTRPTLARYKGKIYPVNRVHSAWVGFEEQGKPGLNQLFMKDFFMMWKQHVADPKANYPQLATIRDDSGDGQIEVNRPEEIDAVLSATQQYLISTGFPLQNRKLVWVSGDRAWYSSTESRDLPREGYEATAYASTYKFSHDVSPARAALGSSGCTDCHRFGSPFFEGRVLDVPFSPANGQPQWIANADILGLSPTSVRSGAIREQWLKPVLYSLIGLIGACMAALSLRGVALRHGDLTPRLAHVLGWVVLPVLVFMGLAAVLTPGLAEYMMVRRFTLDANHFWITLLVLAVALVLALQRPHPRAMQSTPAVLSRILGGLIVLALASGALMLLQAPWASGLTGRAYTVLDLDLVGMALISLLVLVLRLVATPRQVDWEQGRTLENAKQNGGDPQVLAALADGGNAAGATVRDIGS